MCSILKETHREKINLADEAITMESVTMHCEPVQRACCCIIEMNLRNEWEKKGLDVERANGYRSVSIIFFLSYRKNKRIFPKSNSTYRELFNLFNNSEFRCVSLFRLCVVEAHFRFEKKFKIRNLKFSNPCEKEKEFHSFLFPFFCDMHPRIYRNANGAWCSKKGKGTRKVEHGQWPDDPLTHISRLVSTKVKRIDRFTIVRFTARILDGLYFNRIRVVFFKRGS